MTEVASLQAAMLAEVRVHGGGASAAVREALLEVPRHLFLPDVPLEAAYRDQAIVTKRDSRGIPISSSSQPAIMALMLDQLGIQPGQRVLEIGVGSGYNAALLAHLVGPAGTVVSVDIDPEVAQTAEALLAGAGYSRVRVVCADGADGYPPAAPYDRIIATVGVWDLAPAWLAQLAPGGRLVVPLDLRGAQVSVALERAGGPWASRSVVGCGFMRMRGKLAGPEQSHLLDAPTGLTIQLPGPRPLNPQAIGAALATTPHLRDTQVYRAAEEVTGLAVWLAVTEPRTCVLHDEDGGCSALVGALMQGQGFRATPGVVEEASIAVLGREPGSSTPPAMIARGYGPDGDRLAAELATHVQAWQAEGRPSFDRLQITAHPDGGSLAPASKEVAPAVEVIAPGGIIIDKTHTRLVVTVLPPGSNGTATGN
jgi:protein-L-isoaspartate(D-aspartate) O-methyltransferase